MCAITVMNSKRHAPKEALFGAVYLVDGKAGYLAGLVLSSVILSAWPGPEREKTDASTITSLRMAISSAPRLPACWR